MRRCRAGHENRIRSCKWCLERPAPDPKDPRFKNHARLTVHISKELDKAIRVEARRRDLTISQIIEEAFQTRSVFTRQGAS